MHRAYRIPTYDEGLISFRERIGMTQRQIAGHLGISRSSYQKYEYGLRKPRNCVRERLQTLMDKHPA